MSNNPHRPPPRVSFYLMDYMRVGTAEMMRLPATFAVLDPRGVVDPGACRKALATAIDHGLIQRPGDYLCVVTYSDQSNALVVLAVEESRRLVVSK